MQSTATAAAAATTDRQTPATPEATAAVTAATIVSKCIMHSHTHSHNTPPIRAPSFHLQTQKYTLKCSFTKKLVATSINKQKVTQQTTRANKQQPTIFQLQLKVQEAMRKKEKFQREHEEVSDSKHVQIYLDTRSLPATATASATTARSKIYAFKMSIPKLINANGKHLRFGQGRINQAYLFRALFTN